MRESMTVFAMGETISFALERKRVKRLNLRVRGDGSVYVSAPPHIPYSLVEQFVKENAPFIFRARKAISFLPPPAPLQEGSTVFYFGSPYALTLVTGKPSLSFSNGKAQLSLPSPCEDIETAYFSLLNGVFLPYITEACRSFEMRHSRFAGKAKEIRVRRMKSMWGNCRPHIGRLTFSSALAAMPEELIEGVIAHEYTHFFVPDHGARFYTLLSEVSPAHRALSSDLARLKKEHLAKQ